MKILISGIFILSILSISQVYADYDSMKKDLEEYTPQKSFTIIAEPGVQEAKTVPGDAPGVAPGVAKMKTLKKSYEREISDPNSRFIELGVDEEILKRLSGISSNQDALIKHMEQKIRLNEIRVIAVLRNPAIQAAQKKVIAEIQSFDQVMNLDNTLEQYASFTKGINNKVGPLKGKDSIRMMYPFPGVSALKGRIVQSQVATLMEKMQIINKQVLRDVENAYWDFVFVVKSTKITRETIDAFDRLGGVATSLYKSGKTSFQDVIKINIKIEELKEDLVTLKAKKKNIEIRILELLNLPANIRLGEAIVAPQPPKIAQPEALFPIAREHRQELKAIRFQISKLESMVEMSESMIEAPLTLGFSFSENDIVNTTGTDAPKEAFATKTMAAMKNNSPAKPLYGLDEPWLAQTRQNLSSLRQTLLTQENATTRMVRNAWFKTDKNRREFSLYQNRILPLAKSALDVSTREYEAGSIPFSQAIDSYTYWLKVKLTIAKKQADLGTSFAELENIVGKKLHKIQGKTS